jgi:hypothetical protein
MIGDPENSMPSGAGSPRVSFLRMEKYQLGELTAEQRLQVEREVRENANAATYARAMKETQGTLSWLRLRKSLAAENGPGFLASLWARLDAVLPRPSRAALAWGGALCMLLLILPVSMISRTGGTGLRAKGSSRPEITLEVGDHALSAGQSGHARPGDILTFSYRSAKPLFVQVWYVEDGGSPNAFEGKAETALSWPASSKWQKARQRIMLDGNWKTERVLIVASPERISAEQARRLVFGSDKPKGGVEVFAYDLLQP